MSDLARDPNAEEVRVAMALNGGVSLAVWMGGCGVELDAARRAHVETTRPIYTALCEAFARVLVLDVMSGASAGGINGALLAAAIVNRRRLEPDFVRSQWLNLGDFTKLLQPAAKGDPASLLQGAWFREQLGNTFKALIDGEEAPVDKGEVLLDITTTDVAGQPVKFRDFWGQSLEALEYRARFRFRAEEQFTATRLADASRSSASFPVAFEPFDVDGALAGWTGKRWVMDGGLLDNAPIRAAIDLIPGRTAWRQVRRYVCYVNAEPASIFERPEGEPSLAAIAGDIVSLPRKAPFVDQLRAVENATRRGLLADHEPALFGLDLPELEAVAQALLPAYCLRRRLESLDELIEDPSEVTEMVRETPEVPLPWIPTSLAAREGERWQWGIRPAQRAIQLLLDALRRPVAEAGVAARLELFDARRRVGEEYAKLDAHRAKVGHTGNRFAAAVAQVDRVKPWPILEAAWKATRGVVGLLEERDRVTLFGSVFEDFVRRALALEVILRAGGDAPEMPSGQELRFVQLTPEAPTPLLLRRFVKAPAGVPRAKLLGLRLGHFGGFYRGSWRVNDFMWGRLDASARIVEMLVAPGRVQQLAKDGWDGDPPWTVLARALTGGADALQLELLTEAVGDGDLEAALKDDLLREDERRGELTRFVCTRAVQLEVFLDERGPLQKASEVDAELGAGTPPLDFGEPRTALDQFRDGTTMPQRLAAPDEAVSTLALRQSTQAGLVALAALRTAKVPLAGFLFALRALILPVGGTVARVWWVRAGVAVAFWGAALVLSARIVQTDPKQKSLEISGAWALYLALAVIALLVIAGTLLVPAVRVLRGYRQWYWEGAKALALAVTGVVGAALAAWFIAGARVPQLVGAPGATLPAWVVGTVLAIVLGTPLTIVPALLRGKLGNVLEKPYAGWPALVAFAAAAVIAGVASVVQMWSQLTGETWQVIAGWLGLLGAPLAAIACLALWKFQSAPLAADGLGDLRPAADPELPE